MKGATGGPLWGPTPSGGSCRPTPPTASITAVEEALKGGRVPRPLHTTPPGGSWPSSRENPDPASLPLQLCGLLRVQIEGGGAAADVEEEAAASGARDLAKLVQVLHLLAVRRDDQVSRPEPENPGRAPPLDARGLHKLRAIFGNDIVEEHVRAAA